MRKILMPDWFKRLPGDACVNTKEVLKLYGYSEKTSITVIINSGKIPKPSFKNQKKMMLWRVSEIRKSLNQIDHK